MNEVNIYIETSVQGPGKRAGKYIYVLEAERRGRKETRFGSGSGAGENELALRALCDAMGRLIKSCSIRVITRCGHLRGAIRNGWPKQWQQDGWKNAKGKTVGNAELWEKYVDLCKNHKIEAVEWENPHKDWMIKQMSRENEGGQDENSIDH
ncbi:MAG: RNase H family protein [Eisenbergiella sp.]